MCIRDSIHGHGANLLDRTVPFPSGFDTVWMSQFLDCFSEEEATSILSRVAQSASKDSKVYIMQTLWDRQPYETGSYCLTQISLYFTARHSLWKKNNAVVWQVGKTK